MTQYGIERNDDRHPKWIRPVSHQNTGEISNCTAKNIKVLDVIKLQKVKSCPNYAQSENYFYEHMEVIKRLPCTEKNMNKCIDTNSSYLFYNPYRAVSAELYKSISYSLMFIRVDHATFYFEQRYNSKKMRLKVSFTYNGHSYDFLVIDP